MAKKLGQFEVFNAPKFLKDKNLLALATAPMNDSESKQQIGYTVTAVVYEDNTDYGDNGVTTNAGESFKIKIPNLQMNQIQIPAFVRLIEPTGKVWGEFRNNLSISAENIVPIEEKK